MSKNDIKIDIYYRLKKLQNNIFKDAQTHLQYRINPTPLYLFKLCKEIEKTINKIIEKNFKIIKKI